MPPMKCPASREDVFETDRTVTLTHLAKQWDVPRRKVRRLLQTRKLPFVQVAGQIRVPASVVRTFECSNAELD